MISINSSASPSSGLAITPLQPTQSIPNEATPPNSTPAFDRSTFSGTREHVTASPIQNTSTTSGPVDSGATTEVSSTILTSQPPSPTSPPSDQSNPPSNEPSQAIQNLLAERRRRLETDKKEKEAAEKAERKAKAEARKESVLLDPNSAKAKQAIHAQQQRRKQQEAKSERERVLRQIESDKAERKQREEQRKTLAKADAEGKDASLVEQQLRSEMNGPKTTISNECAIQIRTFDGSTIRGKFPSGCTVRTDVRTWLDAQRGNGGLPYTLKQILIPLPNRALSISDEEETLQSLGLTPNATLVMVPIQAYTAAYKRSPGIVSRGASAGYNVVSAGAGMITGALGPFLGLITDQRTPTQADIPPNITTQSSPETEVRGSGSGLNVRTLRDQRDHEDQQLYNGNQVSCSNVAIARFGRKAIDVYS